MMTPRLARFMKDRVVVNSESGCWEASGYASKYGYRKLKVSKHKAVRAHRFVYEELVGPIGEGLELDHLCRNTCCVNPVHLQPVTHAENMRRTRRDVCYRGHPLVEGNVYTKASGSRCCRTCALTTEARRKRRIREAS